MGEKVFLNDGIVDIENARVPVSDGGLLYGAGLFETMRANNGVVFRLDFHLDRLLSSADKLLITTTYSKEHLHEAVYKTLEANALQNARLRLTITSGSISAGDEKPKSTLIVTATELVPYPAEYYRNGILVILCPFRQNPSDPTCGHKTTNYLSRISALDFARRRNAAEALWFTVDNRLAEGCVSNAFLVKDDQLLTPQLDTPVLPGIARTAIAELADQQGLDLIQKDLYIDDCLEADEIFLTNVIMKVLPVHSIEKHPVGNGKVGPITKKFQKLFDDLIEKECGEK